MWQPRSAAAPKLPRAATRASRAPAVLCLTTSRGDRRSVIPPPQQHRDAAPRRGSAAGPSAGAPTPSRGHSAAMMTYCCLRCGGNARCGGVDIGPSPRAACGTSPTAGALRGQPFPARSQRLPRLFSREPSMRAVGWARICVSQLSAPASVSGVSGAPARGSGKRDIMNKRPNIITRRYIFID